MARDDLARRPDLPVTLAAGTYWIAFSQSTMSSTFAYDTGGTDWTASTSSGDDWGSQSRDWAFIGQSNLNCNFSLRADFLAA